MQSAQINEKLCSDFNKLCGYVASSKLLNDDMAYYDKVEVNEKTKEITDLLKLVSDDVISNKAGKENVHIKGSVHQFSRFFPFYF